MRESTAVIERANDRKRAILRERTNYAGSTNV